MRILLCTDRDLTGNICLNKLVRALHAEHELRVFLSDKSAGAACATHMENVRLWHDFPINKLFRTLDARHMVTPDTLIGEDELLTFEQIAAKYRISVEVVPSISNDAAVEAVKSFQPDLILSCRFLHIFRPNVIAIPRLGIFNIHPGPLPKYPGLKAPFWQLLNDEPRLGVTLHVIDAGIDTGPLVDVRYLDADRRRSFFWHELALFDLGIRMFLEALPRLGTALQPTPQSHRVPHYRIPTQDAYDSFAAKGLRCMDASEYAAVLARYHGLGDPSM